MQTRDYFFVASLRQNCENTVRNTYKQKSKIKTDQQWVERKKLFDFENELSFKVIWLEQHRSITSNSTYNWHIVSTYCKNYVRLSFKKNSTWRAHKILILWGEKALARITIFWSCEVWQLCGRNSKNLKLCGSITKQDENLGMGFVQAF